MIFRQKFSGFLFGMVCFQEMKNYIKNSFNSYFFVCDGFFGYLFQYLNVIFGILFIIYFENIYFIGYFELRRVNFFCCIFGGILLIWDFNGGFVYLF